MTSLGTVQHGGTRVYEGFESRFDDLKSDLKDVQEMREQVKNNPNLSDSERESMLESLDKAEAAIQQGLDYATNSGRYDTTAGNKQNDGDHSAVEAAMARAENSMNHVEQQLMIADRLPPAQVSGPPASQGASGASGTGGASGADGASGAGGTSSSSDAVDSNDYLDIADLDVDNMVKLMSTDPAAAMATLKGLDPEQRGIALQTINAKLQEMNQMFSMMSNMSKSLHDTAKAAINNMRV